MSREIVSPLNFSSKKERYAGAVKIIEEIEGSVKDNDIKKLFDIIKYNKSQVEIADNYINKDKSKNASNRECQRIWNMLNERTQSSVLYDGGTKKIQEFLSSLSADIVKRKEYKGFYEACMESFLTNEGRTVKEWEIKKEKAQQHLENLQEWAKKNEVGLTDVDFKIKYDNITQELNEEMKLRNITNIKDPKITLPESMAKKVQKLEELKGAYQSLNNWKKEMQEINAMRIDENLINNDLIEMAKKHYQNINNQKSPLHSNSKEFKNMEKALQTIANWNSEDEIERRRNDKNAPQTMKAAMEDLKRVSLEYKLEKKKQWRPRPSEMRVSRIIFADSMVEFAEKGTRRADEMQKQKQATFERMRDNALGAYTQEQIKNVNVQPTMYSSI